MLKKFYGHKKERIPFTKDGYDKILEEKSRLMAERPEAVENLRKSRELGDLSENGYYKAARARLSFLDGRIKRVDRLIKFGVIVESRAGDQVDIGSTVIISDGSKEYTYTIVGGYESDPLQKTISYKSPIGSALIGKKAQDVVEVQAPKGLLKFTVISVN